MSESKYREAYNKGFKDGENHAFDGYVQQCYDELPYGEQIELLVLRQIWNEIEELQQDILKSSETPLDSAYNINIGISMALGIIRKYMKEYTK